MLNEDENVKMVISAEVDPLMKDAFREWWKANNYATEAEAVRTFVREKIQIKPLGKRAFTIIELLTVMSIIIILMGIMMSSLVAVRKYAKKVAQRGMFHDIGKGLEMFSIDFDGYPDSSAGDLDGDHYCGAMKLCEAMIGQDGIGFHPDSVFDDDGMNALKDTPLYFNRDPLPDEDDPSGPERLNLQARQLYLEGEGVQITSIEYLGASEFDPCCPVLCDVFKRHQLQVLGEKTGMPILYYKANTSKLLHEGEQLAGGLATYSAGDNIYNYYDNYDIIILGVPWTDQPHAYEDTDLFNPLQIFFDQTKNKDIKTMDKPHNPSTYILQSAGWDGLYGTEDDIFNFER